MWALLKQLHGRRSEKVDPNQLQLFLDAPSSDPVARALAPEPPRPVGQPLPKPKPGPHGRKRLPAEPPRETVALDPTECDRRCAAYGVDKVLIGHETSEVLEWKPGH